MKRKQGFFLFEHEISQEDVHLDIDLFSRSVVDQKLPKKDDALRADLAQKMTAKCCGMFLWIYLQARQLRSGKNGKQLQQIIADMPTRLDRAYERDIKNILNLDESERSRAINIPRLAIFAKRPLTVYEITEALIMAGSNDEDSFSPDEMPDCIDEEYIREEFQVLCGTLLQIRKPETGIPDCSGTVHLVHFSVKQYLLAEESALRIPSLGKFRIYDQRLQQKWFAKICLRYLDSQVVWQGHGLDVSAAIRDDGTHHFVRYAATYWDMHATNNGDDQPEDLIQMINKSFHPENFNWNHWRDCFEAERQDPIEKDDFSTTFPTNSLYYAAMLGLPSTVRYLHGEGVDINALGGIYGSSLQVAVIECHHLMVETLVNLGANVNLECGLFKTPLLASAYAGNLRIFELLVASGSDITCQSPLGRTALSVASEHGFVDIVEALLNKGSNVEIPNNEGYTPLCFAAWCGRSDVAHLLLSHGANLHRATIDGLAPLHLAAVSGHTDIVELLLGHGALVNGTDNYDQSPLHFATRKGHIDVVKLLFSSGGEINVPCRNKFTPLHLAVQQGHSDIAEFLINQGSCLETKTFQGRTPLHVAAACKNKKLVKILLDYGSVVNSIHAGFSALHSAVENRDAGMVEILLDEGIDINAVASGGQTALYDAIFCEYIDIAELLIDRNATLDTICNSGWRPLDVAAFNGN